MGEVMLLLLAIIYFVPSLIAISLHRRNMTAMIVANVFVGWTFIGWVVVFIWVLMKESEVKQ